MHAWLPTLIRGDVALRLPLSSAAEADLAAALLSAPADASAQVAAWLALEPAVVFWAACCAWLRGGTELSSLPDIAAWLARHALDELRDEPAPPAVQARPPDWSAFLAAFAAGAQDKHIPPGRFAEISSLAARVGYLAGELARSAGADADHALLQGLLHNAEQWSPSRSNLAPLTLLPPTLAHALTALKSGRDPESLAQHAVRQAMAVQRGDWAFEPLSAKRTAALEAIDGAARARWRPTPSSGRLLGPLSEKLRRLWLLETNFQEALDAAKLESLKELAYGAGHEINNPLANISARAQTLLKEETDPERRLKLAAINAQAFRAHEMIADLMLFARPPQPELELVDLSRLLTRLVDDFRPVAAAQRTDLTIRLPKTSRPITADPAQLAVAVRALLTNALEALGQAGQIDVELAFDDATFQVGAPTQPAAKISVADTGPGISPATRAHLFDPFFSGREAGRGLGFGLTKCWRIVTGLGGQIRVDSQPGRGATFTILIPLEGHLA